MCWFALRLRPSARPSEYTSQSKCIASDRSHERTIPTCKHCKAWRAHSALTRLGGRVARAPRLPARLEMVFNRPRGVTVSTLDSESSDRGSNPREAFCDRRHNEGFLKACHI